LVSIKKRVTKNKQVNTPNGQVSSQSNDGKPVNPFPSSTPFPLDPNNLMKESGDITKYSKGTRVNIDDKPSDLPQRWISVVSSLITDSISTEFSKIKKKLKGFDIDKDGHLDRKEVNDMIASREFWGIVVLFLLPIATALLQTWQVYQNGNDWSWDSIILVFQFILAPVALAWIRKVFNVSNKDLESQIIGLQDDIQNRENKFQIREQQLISAINLQAQFIQLNVPKDNLPSDVFFEEVRGEELKDENINLRADNSRLEQELKAAILRLKQMDPHFETQFVSKSQSLRLRNKLL
jgi:hypothetical protein